MGLKLGNTDTVKPALMLNLLGEPGYEGKVILTGMEDVDSQNVYIHLYGKEITKPGRKMGHITVLGEHKAELLISCIELKNKVKVKST
jgi:5-(carboxyamino)imidazole ribonucleotide synthase